MGSEMTTMNKLARLGAAVLLAAAATTAQAQLRPEVGKPLQAASEYLKAGKAREAMAKVREADAVGGKTGAESLMIERMRGAAAQRLGDHGTAAQAFEAIFPRVSGRRGGPGGRATGLRLFQHPRLRQGQAVAAEGAGPGQQQWPVASAGRVPARPER